MTLLTARENRIPGFWYEPNEPGYDILGSP